ncbi:hypothetical protein [Thiohalophilus sp.]|uniref:hypothetical protein n=1 Tax=Thiohalophilus sp. TaxID=3028392 RepID=UPI00397695FA
MTHRPVFLYPLSNAIHAHIWNIPCRDYRNHQCSAGLAIREFFDHHRLTCDGGLQACIPGAPIFKRRTVAVVLNMKRIELYAMSAGGQLSGREFSMTQSSAESFEVVE